MELHERPAPYPAEATALPEPPRCGLCELAPPESSDPVVEAFKKDVDRTLLVENLKLNSAQRAEKLQNFMRFLEGIRQAGRRLRGEHP